MVWIVNQQALIYGKRYFRIFTYQPLRDLMAERDLSFQHLRKNGIVDSVAAVKLNNDDGYVSLRVLDKLCSYLDVPIDKIVAHIDYQPE